MQNKYKSIVIGSGSIAQNCILSLINRDFEIIVFEFSKNNSKSLENFCNRNDVKYKAFNNKEELSNVFLKINENTLVVSASNRYLFPEEVIQNENLEIINYHSSLLPKYPGRNAEAWAIFEGELNAGITWHRVSLEVDAGDIIKQLDTPINADSTSLSLLKEFNKLATKAFDGIVVDYQYTGINYFKQVGYSKDDLKYSWMKPNNGILDLAWSEKKVSQFLRSFNYGIFKNMGDFIIPGFSEQVKFYEYVIHDKNNFTPKFRNNYIIEKETKIFELLIDES